MMTVYKGMVGRVYHERRGTCSSKPLSGKCRLYSEARGKNDNPFVFSHFEKFSVCDSQLSGTKKGAEKYPSIHPYLIILVP